MKRTEKVVVKYHHEYACMCVRVRVLPPFPRIYHTTGTMNIKLCAKIPSSDFVMEGRANLYVYSIGYSRKGKEAEDSKEVLLLRISAGCCCYKKHHSLKTYPAQTQVR